MDRVGVRMLQQNASAVLRRVRGGESVEVTDRGRPVALLVPLAQASAVDLLDASGRLEKAEGDLLALGEPIKTKPGAESASARLRKMRRRER